MIKGKWLTRALHVTIALSFVLGAFVVAPSVSADPGTSKWEKQGMPTEADKVLLPGSDIIDFDLAGDGKTVYAIGTLYRMCEDDQWVDDGESYGPNDLLSPWHYPKLWKSTDAGVTWKDQTSKALDAKNLPDMGTAAAWDDFAFFACFAPANQPRVEAALKERGLEATTRQRYTTGDKDYAAQVLSVKNAGSEAVVIYGTNSEDDAIILRTIKDMSPGLVVMGSPSNVAQVTIDLGGLWAPVS